MEPLDFDDTARLARSLEGADSLFNAYWVPWGEVTFERAVQNTQALIKAAESAGVRRKHHGRVAWLFLALLQRQEAP